MEVKYRLHSQNDWTPGFGIVYGLFNEMILYCLLGTQIVIAVSIITHAVNILTSASIKNLLDERSIYGSKPSI